MVRQRRRLAAENHDEALDAVPSGRAKESLGDAEAPSFRKGRVHNKEALNARAEREDGNIQLALGWRRARTTRFSIAIGAAIWLTGRGNGRVGLALQDVQLAGLCRPLGLARRGLTERGRASSNFGGGPTLRQKHGPYAPGSNLLAPEN